MPGPQKPIKYKPPKVKKPKPGSALAGAQATAGIQYQPQPAQAQPVMPPLGLGVGPVSYNPPVTQPFMQPIGPLAYAGQPLYYNPAVTGSYAYTPAAPATGGGLPGLTYSGGQWGLPAGTSWASWQNAVNAQKWAAIQNMQNQYGGRWFTTGTNVFPGYLAGTGGVAPQGKAPTAARAQWAANRGVIRIGPMGQIRPARPPGGGGAQPQPLQYQYNPAIQWTLR
jgi:hypothetical protein